MGEPNGPVVSTIIEDISQICRDDPRKRCVYWYFQFNVRESQAVENMLRSDILEALKTIPKSLQEFYQLVMEGIAPSERRFARSILLWLSFCVRPLTLEEVAAAAGLPVPEHVIRICTTSFVNFWQSDGQVKLAHFSVKEFLVTNAHEGHWYQLSALSSHRALAEDTLRLLLQKTEEVSEDDVCKEALLHYAACNWHEHFKASTCFPQNPGPQTIVDELFCHPTIYRNWRCLLTCFRELYVRPAPICTASELGLIQTVNELLKLGIEGLGPVLESINAVYIAAQAGHLDVLDLLLKRVAISIDTAERTFEIVRRHGLRTKTLEDMVKNLSDSGVLYAGTGGQDVRIDERIVIAAVKNKACGLELMTILLDQYEARGIAIVPVTEQVLASTLKNKESGCGILQLLLERRGGDVRIYPGIKELLACPMFISSSTLSLLLEARHEEISLDERFLESFAEDATGPQMEAILRTLGDDFLVTERVLEAEAHNTNGGGAMHQIIRRQEHGLQVSERRLCSVAKDCFNSVEILGTLLDECGPDFPVGENVMLAVVQHWDAHRMLNMLLYRQQAGFNVSQMILLQAARNPHVRDVLEILMNNGGLKVPLTEEIVRAALTSDKAMSYLLDLEEGHIRTVPITDEMLLDAVHSLSADTLHTIFRKRPNIQVTDGMFVGASRDLSKLSLLLQQSYSQLPVEQMIQDLGTRPHGNPVDVIKFILDQKLLEIDERVLEIFANNLDALEFLLERKPLVPITEQTVIRSATGVGTWPLLLDKRIQALPISTEVMIAVVRAYDPGASYLQRFLAHFGLAVPITERVLLAATQNLAALQLLFQAQGPNTPRFLSEELVFLATYHGFPAMSWLLQECGSAVPLTERVLVAATAQSLTGVLYLIREQFIDINLQQIWKGIWNPGLRFL
ncbi:uncharacterized protein LDX57_007181 [Aspergillus melleus]|uniref:uncharacterized protein n=1 Tax=Aspergillus melleus TaxID=138277 RepID=UPI001E8DA0C0|nr:uncharacterized protein LDX57_007181 [Aspergillus melleus]KAH8429519.1 hypothetical protein LDX57_007181 [Aspergillus melleus]